MLKLQWNALRPGDRVAVHDEAKSQSPLNDGVVVLVQKAADSNDVSVQLNRTAAQKRSVVHPHRWTVHQVPRDPTEACWRCEAASDRGERDASARRATPRASKTRHAAR